MDTTPETDLMNSKVEPINNDEQPNTQNTSGREEEEKIGGINDYDMKALTSTDENHLIKSFSQHKVINTLIILFTTIAIVSEYFYRDRLFKYSIDFERDWQNITPPFVFTIFKIITKVGGEYLMAFPIGIVTCFFSLIKTVMFLFGMIFCLHFHSLMKMWYGSKRPFWEDPNLYQGICDGGFGNPSGHSMTTTYLYLGLFLILCETKPVKNHLGIKIILFIACNVWIVLVILSRLILGVHSVNQVIYGSSLGLSLFLIMFSAFKLHEMPVGFYRKLFVKKRYVVPLSFVWCFLCLFSIGSKFMYNQNFDYKKYKQVLDEKCKGLPEYRKFNLDALFGSMIVVGIAGIYYGQMIFWNLIDSFYKIKKSNNNNKNNKNVNKEEISQVPGNKISVVTNKEEENAKIENNKYTINENNGNFDDEEENHESQVINELINNWHENRKFIVTPVTNAYKIIFVLTLCISPVLLFGLVPKDTNMVLIFIFKFGIPFFLVLFNIFGPGFYFVIKISCGTKEILIRRSYVKNDEDENDIKIKNADDGDSGLEKV